MLWCFRPPWTVGCGYPGQEGGEQWGGCLRVRLSQTGRPSCPHQKNPVRYEWPLGCLQHSQHRQCSRSQYVFLQIVSWHELLNHVVYIIILRLLVNKHKSRTGPQHTVYVHSLNSSGWEFLKVSSVKCSHCHLDIDERNYFPQFILLINIYSALKLGHCMSGYCPTQKQP